MHRVSFLPVHPQNAERRLPLVRYVEAKYRAEMTRGPNLVARAAAALALAWPGVVGAGEPAPAGPKIIYSCAPLCPAPPDEPRFGMAGLHVAYGGGGSFAPPDLSRGLRHTLDVAVTFGWLERAAGA